MQLVDDISINRMASMPLVTKLNVSMHKKIRRDWFPFALDFEGLSQRLVLVKKEFGMKRAISSRSIAGETRTFAEILDKEVEKIVLFYITQQGRIAGNLWQHRETNFTRLKSMEMTIADIDKACEIYRCLGQVLNSHFVGCPRGLTFYYILIGCLGFVGIPQCKCYLFEKNFEAT